MKLTMINKKISYKLPIILLVCAILFGVGLRTFQFVQKPQFYHDEGISYLAATCHQETYAQTYGGGYPLGTWVEASEWKQFIQIDKQFCFGDISSGLA